MDKSPDSQNNREPKKKGELLSCLVTDYGHGTLRVMGYDVTDGEENWLEAYSHTPAWYRDGYTAYLLNRKAVYQTLLTSSSVLSLAGVNR